MSNKQCAWKKGDDGDWHTECGKSFYIGNGTPDEYKLPYCPSCRKPIVQSQRSGRS